MKILVVDDEEMIRILSKKILERAGYEVLLVESGEEGIRELGDTPGDISLALVDLNLDGLSGVDTIREIRQIVSDLPVIVTTGQLVEEAGIPGDLTHRTFILKKPYVATKLVSKVEEALQQSLRVE